MSSPARTVRAFRWVVVALVAAGLAQASASSQAASGAVGSKAAASTAGSQAARSAAGGSGASCRSVPFRRHDAGYSHFRIPAVVSTADGMLLAFAEGRVDGAGDSGNIDLVLRRSTDGGCTWGRLIVVANHGRNTIGNPAPVYDRVTGKVVLLATGNGGRTSGLAIAAGRATAATTRRVYQLTSSDDGSSWTEREITSSVKAKGWRWYATGPGHAVQLSGGKFAGRLVVTGVHSVRPAATDLGTVRRYSGTHTIISDDHGRSWRIGFVDKSYDGRINTNETAVAELADGRLYFNSRDQHGSAPGSRAFGYSRTGGSTLLKSRFKAAPRIAAPVVQCSVLSLGDRLYFAGPSSLDGTRSRITLRSTTDGGSSGGFDSQVLLWNGYAAYSDLVATSATSVGVLYERGRTSPYDEIAFQSVSATALTLLRAR